MERLKPMKRWMLCLSLLALLAPWLGGGSPTRADETPSPTDFLKQSMSRYQALSSFQAECGWNETFGGVATPKGPGTEADVRTILYAKPNRFKVLSSHSGTRFVQTSVSDGKRLVEYSSMAALPAMTYPAPASLAVASSMQMGHPMFCGTLLYRFFGGPGALKNLADTGKAAITYGPDVDVAGEPCKTVRFYAQGMYGHATIAVSPRDHLVRRITYDSAPLMAMMKAEFQNPQFAKMLKGHKSSIPAGSMTVEEYRKIVVDHPIALTSFDTTVPKGRNVTDMGQTADAKPPVPEGSPAPDFTVSRLGSQRPVKLSSLRGSVVLLDFWATWCPPCRKSLPETQELSTRLSAKGLTVMAISDEEQPTIAKFLKSNHYTFPTYRDGAGSAGKAYMVSAIPTLVVIGKDGRLVAYMVGLQEREAVAGALKKAGLQMPQ